MDNQSPAVMFEIMAIDQERLISFYKTVFGWEENRDDAGFAYICFPLANRSLLGGIGKAQPGVPGWGKGITFYLQVDDVDDFIENIKVNGGAIIVPPETIDGYRFAMFEDPECNLIGLIEPFEPCDRGD
jgi:predicted enzyme related to lactoylglutathione lyase